MTQTSWAQQETNRFFGGRKSPSQMQCDEIAQSVSGASTVSPVDSPGSMSYTVICNGRPGPQQDLIVSILQRTGRHSRRGDGEVSQGDPRRPCARVDLSRQHGGSQSAAIHLLHASGVTPMGHHLKRFLCVGKQDETAEGVVWRTSGKTYLRQDGIREYTSTYLHDQSRTPVRSAPDKQVRARLAVGSVTTSESLVFFNVLRRT
ncbi:hypothetical protein B0T17DRAFT_403216 [Bombardia bombarda]|uniref:Uncharacterized protein n=1 Tax=Bombardia bombarda TaxID=252184 RepID=A0AA39WAN8_9PEZI|nr:hypothetical protein B0T17DRAFT_403216 [Bombardia bombarda]